MKKTLRRLPVLLAVACTFFAASCSDIEVEPVGNDEDNPIVIPPTPPKPKSNAALDSLTIG